MSTEVAVPSTALTVQQRVVIAFGKPTEYETTLVALAKGTEDIKEITNPAGRMQVHAAMMVLKNERVDLQKTGKSVREEATAFSAATIAEEKRLVALISVEEKRLEALRDAWDAAKEAEKQALVDAELARVARIQENIAHLRGNPTLTPSHGSALIADHIGDLEALTVDASYEEFQSQAEATKLAGLARLLQLHTAAVAHDAEQAKLKAEREELAKLREEQAERERVAKVERDAEAARQAADLKAQREKQEAEAKTERERIAAENLAAKLKRDAEDAELKAAQQKAQAIIDSENARVAAENKVIADKLAADNAELARQQAALEESRKPKPPVVTRPTDREIVGAIAAAFGVDVPLAIDWILSMDLSSTEALAA